jgi:5-methylcytosine-specific restriction endonuclease McrA
MNKCGTNAGYQKHCVDKTEKCQPCKKAHSDYIVSYYLKNSEKLRSNRKEKYYLNQEKEINYIRKWRLKNPKHNSSYQKKYRKLNPESKRRSERRRRAKKFENGFEVYKEYQVLEIYGNSCHICLKPIDLFAPRQPGLDGWEMGLHIDHLIPLSKGGPDTINNVRPSHGSCNVKKHSRILSL